jgi:hypothetical protein
MVGQPQDLSVLNDAQDILVIRSAGKDNYVFAAKPSLNFQRQTYQESVSNPEDVGISAFSRYWKFDENVGIRGSSTLLALRYDKRSLRPRNLWIPGSPEARFLEEAGKLENGIYRDYGLAIFSKGGPNEEIASAISRQAEKLGLNLPLINPFMALDYDPNQEANYGINVKLVEAPKGIIHGKEAQEALKSFAYIGNSGAQGVGRDTDGFWYADWNLLDYSDGLGRVDWICGKATQKNLIDAYNALLERKYDTQMRDLKSRKEKELSAFENSLKK